MITETTQAFRIETTISQDGVLELRVPFRAGDNVEVIILNRQVSPEGTASYSLRELPLRYDRPLDPIDENAWDASQ